jgi:prevent-host-death family protein
MAISSENSSAAAGGEGDPVATELVVRIADAKARLSELIQRAERGERVVIARGDVPVIALSPLKRPKASPIGIFARLGIDADLDAIHAAADEDWAEQALDDFEGDLEKEIT